MLIVFSLIGAFGIIAFGSWELKTKAEATYGLTTWMFALAPFLGALLGIALSDLLPVIIRVVLILSLVIGVPIGLSFLYRFVRSDHLNI